MPKLNDVVIITLDKDYPMAFTLNVAEAINVKYGSIDNLPELLSSPSSGISAVKWIATQLINEGLALKALQTGQMQTELTERQLGALCGLGDLQLLQEKILQAAVAGMPTEQETELKNMVAAQAKAQETL